MPGDSAICYGFIGAFQQLSRFVDPQTNTPVLLICASPDSTLYQLILVFTKFARDHPELLNLKPADVVGRALAAAFPCAPKQR